MSALLISILLYLGLITPGEYSLYRLQQYERENTNQIQETQNNSELINQITTSTDPSVVIVNDDFHEL